MLGQPANYSRVVPMLIIAVAGLAAALWADWYWGLIFNSSILYAPFLLLCLWARDRRVLWSVTALVLLAAFAAYFLEGGDLRSLVHRSLSALAILAVAGVMHFLIGAWRTLETHESLLQARAADLERANRELRLRESDIASQNEELQSQTEELERQSEELRVANDELAQRERTLETLLGLSRSLGMDLSPAETMNRICETLGQLVNGAGTATAILLRSGDGGEMAVRCHYGFGGDGLAAERFAASESFAQLVFEQQRTAYLEDVALRPDLQVPQPATGERIVSVLAAPLVVRGKPIGTLEIYGRQRKAWSNDQVALAESLAAQAAISLENAELFSEIESERARLRAVLDTVPFGVAICDGACERFIVNPAGASVLHLQPNAPLSAAADFRWTSYRDGERLAPEQNPLLRAVHHGAIIDGEELELAFPSGRRIFILASAAPIRDANGRIQGGVCAWADITMQKTLQRELDLRRREAEEASVRKTRFLAAASHDIRTPANAISLIAEVIKRTADNPKMVDEIPQLAQEMHASAMSLVNLVTNVLDVTRFDSGKLELHETEFPLSALLQEEVRQTLPLAQAKALEYELQEPPQSLWLLTDRVKLGRVMGNLLGNAIKFTDEGAVRVSARRTESGGVQIQVSDTGIGISPENQEKVFEEFFQLFDPQRSKGSGLGLAICKRLVEALGGTLTLDSAVGKGSTFTVTLPATCVARRDEAARQGSTERV
ncbi:MAG TPA: ATP-binding protein [Tepidisphaeraceae bacterium]|nr:ATP-binding protein [Tepidisphaeraceae bacterium]